MSNHPSFLSNTKLGFDKKVFNTFILLCICSIILFSFKILSHKTCVPFTVVSKTVNNNISAEFFVGDPVILQAKTVSSAQEIVWDFGDQTPTGIGINTQHVYARQGIYTVNASTENECLQTIKIEIKPTAELSSTISDTEVNSTNPIIGQVAPTANTPVSFNCAVKASKYEWNILNSPMFSSQQTQLANYTFPVPGNFVLELKLDGDPTKVYRKEITILPAKVGPSIQGEMPPSHPAHPGTQPNAFPMKIDPAIEELKKKTSMTDEEIKSKFEAVQRGEIDEKAFNEFLCDGQNTKVFIDKKNEWQTVSSIVKLFYQNKKIKKIYDVRCDRDARKCVTIIHLNYDKKGFLGF